MKNKQFWYSLLVEFLPLILAYLILIALIGLLVVLYHISINFIWDIVRFSFPILIVWLLAKCFRDKKTVNDIKKEKKIIPKSPVELQLSMLLREQQQQSNKMIEQLKMNNQEQLDHVELYSHEIKNSLTSLQAAAENNNAVPSVTVIKSIHQANYHLNMLLNDERLSMINHDFIFEWVNLFQLITDILKQNASLFINRKIVPQLKNIEHVQILTDKRWCRFCIFQLLSNAIKYSPDGTTIVIRWTNNTLQIIDQGVGIPSNDLPRIYENGFSGNNGHQTTKSTGMGLYLVKKVTEQLNFSVKVENNLGKGTIASLVFPGKNVHFTN